MIETKCLEIRYNIDQIDVEFLQFKSERDKEKIEYYEMIKKIENIDLNKSIESVNALPSTVVHTNVKIKPAIFKGESYEKPVKFISDLKKYINMYKVKEGDEITLISSCLEKSVKDWFYINEKYIKNFLDFEERFRPRFWNQEIQESLKRKLNLGSYRENGKLSRVDYALKLFNSAEDLGMSEDETELVRLISLHFGRDKYYKSKH